MYCLPYTLYPIIMYRTRSAARYTRNTSSPYVLEVHICPMHYYITCLLKSTQLELSHYLTLSHYPVLSQPRPLTVSLPKCLRMRTSNFLPQTRGWLISQWQKLVSLLAVSLPRLPHGRSYRNTVTWLYEATTANRLSRNWPFRWTQVSVKRHLAPVPHTQRPSALTRR